MGILSKMPFVLFSIMNFYSSIKTVSAFWKLLWTCFSGGTSDKEPSCQCRRLKRHGFNPWIREISWRRASQPTPVFWQLQSIWSQRVGHDWGGLACMHVDTARQSHLLPWFYSFLLLEVLSFSFFLSLSADRHWGVLEHWSLIWQQVCILRARTCLALSRCSINRYWMNTFYISEYLFSWK